MSRKIEVELPYTKEEIENMDWLSYKHCVLNPIARKMSEDKPMTVIQKLSEVESEEVRERIREFNLSESGITNGNGAFEFHSA